MDVRMKGPLLGGFWTIISDELIEERKRKIHIKSYKGMSLIKTLQVFDHLFMSLSYQIS